MTYTRNEGDISFRKVSVAAPNVGKFEDFQTRDQTVSYSDIGFVLEVMREDGSTELIYDGMTAEVSYRTEGNNIRINQVPMDRIWLRKNGRNGMVYKAPKVRPNADGSIVIHIPGGTSDIELVGDKYFEKVYTLKATR